MPIRALLTVVVVMGVLIVAGVLTLAITIFHRLGPSPAGTATLLEATAVPGNATTTLLDEQPGTRIQSVTATGDRLAVLLQGGGADRIVLLDPRSGQVVGHIGLAR